MPVDQETDHLREAILDRAREKSNAVLRPYGVEIVSERPPEPHSEIMLRDSWSAQELGMEAEAPIMSDPDLIQDYEKRIEDKSAIVLGMTAQPGPDSIYVDERIDVHLGNHLKRLPGETDKEFVERASNDFSETQVHEIGHAYGLEHKEDGFVMEAHPGEHVIPAFSPDQDALLLEGISIGRTNRDLIEAAMGGLSMPQEATAPLQTIFELEGGDTAFLAAVEGFGGETGNIASESTAEWLGADDLANVDNILADGIEGGLDGFDDVIGELLDLLG